jgi:integrase
MALGSASGSGLCISVSSCSSSVIAALPGSDRRASQSESEPWAIERSFAARVTLSSQRWRATIRRVAMPISCRELDLCVRRANERDEAAVGAMTAFLLGLRASEVTDRVVRDLDDDGRLLWIEFGKTKRSAHAGGTGHPAALPPGYPVQDPRT